MPFYFLLLRLPASSDVTQSRYRSQNGKLFLTGFQILESFRSSSNLKSAFFGSHIIELDSKGIGDSSSSYCYLFSFDLSGLAMCHFHHFGFGIRNYPFCILKDVSFGPP